MFVWDEFLAALFSARRPASVLIAGAGDAALVERTVTLALTGHAVVHVAGRALGFDVAALRARGGDQVVVHRANPIDAIGLIPTPDLVWIGGDHNWHTVYHTLLALHARAVALGRAFPAVVISHTGWPFGRRDSYADPASIPAAFRHPHEFAGVRPGSDILFAGSGLFADRFNAVESGARASGVLTAVEDFVEARPGAWEMLKTPANFGLALIYPAGGDAARALAPVKAGMAAGSLTARLSGGVEAARVAGLVDTLDARVTVAQGARLNARLSAALAAEQAAGDGWAARARANAVAPPAAAAAAPVAPRGPVRRLRRLARRLLRGAPPTPADRLTDTERADVARLRSSPIFDAGWYVFTYPDVAAAGFDPALHYLRGGAAEGRDPGPHFSTAFYLAQNEDVAAAGINPLLHYLRGGADEGRDPSPVFDSRAYVEQSPDVAAAGLNPLEHYLMCGRAEGRRLQRVFVAAV